MADTAVVRARSDHEAWAGTLARRYSAVAVATATVAAVLAAVLAGPPAGALARGRITLTEDEIKEVTISAMTVNNPAGTHTPEECTAAPYCDTIPLTVVRPPGFDGGDDYFVLVELSWESPIAPSPLEARGERALTDLDLFLYHDPVQPDAGPAQDGVVASAVSSGAPEFAALAAPEGDYSIVVYNFVGATTAYTLKVRWVSDTPFTPFESLAPTITPNRPVDASAPVIPRPVAVPAVASGGGALDAPSVVPARIPLAPLEPDVAFDTGFEDIDFADTLSAPPEAVRRPPRTPEARPPSGMTLVLWLLVVPVGAVALAGRYLVRLRMSSLPLGPLPSAGGLVDDGGGAVPPTVGGHG